jgi:hypothetical protein
LGAAAGQSAGDAAGWARKKKPLISHLSLSNQNSS